MKAYFLTGILPFIVACGGGDKKAVDTVDAIVLDTTIETIEDSSSSTATDSSDSIADSSDIATDSSDSTADSSSGTQSDTVNDSSDVSGLTFAEFVQNVPSQWCAKYQYCYPVFALPKGYSPEDSSGCEQGIRAMVTDYNVNREFDAASAQKCIDFLNGYHQCPLSADDGRIYKQCAAAFGQELLEGEPCDFGGECAADLYCPFLIAGGICDVATCQPTPKLGEDCSDSLRCYDAEKETYCGEGYICREREVRLAYLGDECTDTVIDGVRVNYQCVGATRCLPQGNGYACQRVAMGDSCTGVSSCLQGMCSAEQICEPVLLQTEEGASCASDIMGTPPYEICSTVHRLGCNPSTHQCERWDGMSGSSCGRGFQYNSFFIPCQPGYYCIFDETVSRDIGTCEPLKELGQACTEYFECVDGAHCDSTNICKSNGCE